MTYFEQCLVRSRTKLFSQLYILNIILTGQRISGNSFTYFLHNQYV